MFRWLAILTLTIALPACITGRETPPSQPLEISAQADDGVTVFGTTYFSSLSNAAPLIVLFHQGGSNARAEYGPLIPWFHQNGYRIIAWDLRVGGDIFGMENRTAGAMLPEEASSYCEGHADMQAALEASLPFTPTGDAIIWGSSYSAALVFHLGADNPNTVSSIVAASPASGSPMADCLARTRLDDLTRPALVLRPGSEMEGEGAQNQKALFEAAGVPVLVFENGVHGSSMLVDARTEADMTDARAAVMAWLNQTIDPS